MHGAPAAANEGRISGLPAPDAVFDQWSSDVDPAEQLAGEKAAAGAGEDCATHAAINFGSEGHCRTNPITPNFVW